MSYTTFKLSRESPYGRSVVFLLSEKESGWASITRF